MFDTVKMGPRHTNAFSMYNKDVEKLRGKNKQLNLRAKVIQLSIDRFRNCLPKTEKHRLKFEIFYLILSDNMSDYFKINRSDHFRFIR